MAELEPNGDEHEFHPAVEANMFTSGPDKGRAKDTELVQEVAAKRNEEREGLSKYKDEFIDEGEGGDDRKALIVAISKEAVEQSGLDVTQDLATDVVSGGFDTAARARLQKAREVVKEASHSAFGLEAEVRQEKAELAEAAKPASEPKKPWWRRKD